MPDQPAQPDARTVNFSQGGIAGGGGNVTASAALLPVAIFGGIGVSLAGFFGLAKYPWLPLGARATIITVIFLIVVIALIKATARGYTRVMSALKMPMEMDPTADINVICWPDQMKRMAALIPPRGNAGAFEPEACRVWVARRTSMVKRMQDKRVRKRMLISIILLPLLINAVVHLSIHNLIDPTAVLGVLAVALTIPVAWGFVRPTFLRVAPGRVDVVRFGFLGGTPTIEMHSLRDRPVRLDLRRKELLIGGWTPIHPEPIETDPTDEASGQRTDDKEATHSMILANQANKDPQAAMGSPAQIRALVIIPLWATLDVRTLQEAVFRAAVSTAEPGPLPDDRLIG